MAIVNRTLDPSEQINCVQSNYDAVATGATLHVAVIPYQSTLKGVKMAVAGLSGSPGYALRVLRFITGTGVTTIDVGGGATLVPLTVGTSGLASFSLLASGNTLLNLLAGDILTVTSAVANTAVTNLSVAAVIQATQDIKSTLGSST